MSGGVDAVEIEVVKGVVGMGAGEGLGEGEERREGRKRGREEGKDVLDKIFGDVGEHISDFSCAVESRILLHGRMYVTHRFICFYSNLFGFEKKVDISWALCNNVI